MTAALIAQIPEYSLALSSYVRSKVLPKSGGVSLKTVASLSVKVRSLVRAYRLISGFRLPFLVTAQNTVARVACVFLSSGWIAKKFCRLRRSALFGLCLALKRWVFVKNSIDPTEASFMPTLSSQSDRDTPPPFTPTSPFRREKSEKIFRLENRPVSYTIRYEQQPFRIPRFSLLEKSIF